MGYMVVAVQHQLSTDPKLATSGNLFIRRTLNWQTGAKNLQYVKDRLSARYPHYAWEQLTLIGHSNGGDISAWAVNQWPNFAKTVITLDHRRVPLPRTNNTQVLSIRANDFQADSGVLPSVAEQKQFNACILWLKNAKHNDMHDGGPKNLQAKIRTIMMQFLQSTYCGQT